MRQKLGLYQRYGVREYWIVDIESRTVNIWTGGEEPLDTRHVASAGSRIESKVLPELKIGLDEVFAGVEKIRLD